MAAKKPKPAPKTPKRPPTAPPPEVELAEFMTGDLGVVPPPERPVKVKAPTPVVVEAPVLVQTPANRAFSDPAPVESPEGSGLGTATHRANCDPPSRP